MRGRERATKATYVLVPSCLNVMLPLLTIGKRDSISSPESVHFYTERRLSVEECERVRASARVRERAPHDQAPHAREKSERASTFSSSSNSSVLVWL